MRKGPAVGKSGLRWSNSANTSLPAAAQPMIVHNTTYYDDGNNYYQPCAQGSDMNYCVVSDPNP